MVRLAGGMALVTIFVEVASAQPAQPSYRVTHDTYGCAQHPGRPSPSRTSRIPGTRIPVGSTSSSPTGIARPSRPGASGAWYSARATWPYMTYAGTHRPARLVLSEIRRDRRDRGAAAIPDVDARPSSRRAKPSRDGTGPALVRRPRSSRPRRTVPWAPTPSGSAR